MAVVTYVSLDGYALSTPALKGEHLSALGSQQKGPVTIIFAAAVPHCGFCSL